jgi:hypothetical protein
MSKPYIVTMRNTQNKIADTSYIEERFIYANHIDSILTIEDDEGQKLGFHKNENGNKVIFTKDLEGVDVAIEHCIDGSKVFHLSQDSKGLPAMHEFCTDGTEIMYLLDANKKLEKRIETKSNGDKITTWFYAEEVISQEQRQRGGTVFKIINANGEATVWLKPEGNVESSGTDLTLKRVFHVFNRFLDGADSWSN